MRLEQLVGKLAIRVVVDGDDDYSYSYAHDPILVCEVKNNRYIKCMAGSLHELLIMGKGDEFKMHPRYLDDNWAEFCTPFWDTANRVHEGQ